jgi:hypothetical protein
MIGNKYKVEMKVCITLFFILINVFCFGIKIDRQENATVFSHGNLCISSNGRFLMHADGTPFFYLGDTAWELFHKLNSGEVELYFEDRRSKGFTVIQAVILPENDGLNTPNRNGDRPLIDNNPTKPNEAYFRWIDKVIQLAASKGLYIGLLPTWGDKVDRQWGTGPEIFNEENMAVYGKYLAKRYAGFPNIIWINGGDRKGGGGNFAIWDVLGKAIKSEDKNHLMTYHPSGEASSSQWFHHCEWLDFNSCQTGHAQTDFAIYRLLIADYNLQPAKPCMDMEPRYEDIPVGFIVENPRFVASDVRQTLYWSLFSGAFGYTYGCNDIWQFYTTETAEGVLGARNGWQAALQLPGASQLVYARRLLMKYDFFSRIPDQGIILTPQHDPADKAVATRGNGYAFIYFPNGNELEISLEKTAVEKLLLKWYNPRNGKTTPFGELKAKGSVKLKPQSQGKGNDWILIMERF